MIKELRIGNLVISSWWDTILPVKGITEKGVLYSVDGESADEAFTPINLTEEWLLRMRFTFDKDAMIGSELGWQIDINEMGVEFSFINEVLTMPDDVFQIEFKYVHDFQNWYYSNSGKKELTIKTEDK